MLAIRFSLKNTLNETKRSCLKETPSLLVEKLLNCYIMNLQEKSTQIETGLEDLVRSSFEDLKAQALKKGLLFYLLFRLARIRYVVWLWLIREIAIIKHLTVNFEKIPKGTPSRVIVYPFFKFARMKEFLLKIDIRLQRRLY